MSRPEDPGDSNERPDQQSTGDPSKAEDKAAFAQTLPGIVIPPHLAQAAEALAEAPGDGDVISSSRRVPTGRPDQPGAPGIFESSTDDDRIGEHQARAILDARFRAAGMALVADFAFSESDLAVHLDGFDPDRRIGYAYLSHGDADVVTDFDEATELAFRQLASDGVAHVLVIHDEDIPTSDVLERRIDAFFADLQRSSQGSQRP